MNSNKNKHVLALILNSENLKQDLLQLVHVFDIY